MGRLMYVPALLAPLTACGLIDDPPEPARSTTKSNITALFDPVCSPEWHHGSDTFSACVFMSDSVEPPWSHAYGVEDHLALIASRPMTVDVQIEGLWTALPGGPWVRDGVIEDLPVGIANDPNSIDDIVYIGFGLDLRINRWYTVGAVFRNNWPDGTVGGWATLDGKACWWDGMEFSQCFVR